MPFIKPERRERMIQGNLENIEPGDLCFYYYHNIMQKWRSNPRWTTVDQILIKLFPDDDTRAEILAFLVFFSLHVMPYENEKRLENGDI